MRDSYHIVAGLAAGAGEVVGLHGVATLHVQLEHVVDVDRKSVV